MRASSSERIMVQKTATSYYLLKVEVEAILFPLHHLQVNRATLVLELHVFARRQTSSAPKVKSRLSTVLRISCFS